MTSRYAPTTKRNDLDPEPHFWRLVDGIQLVCKIVSLKLGSLSFYNSKHKNDFLKLGARLQEAFRNASHIGREPVAIDPSRRQKLNWLFDRPLCTSQMGVSRS